MEAQGLGVKGFGQRGSRFDLEASQDGLQRQGIVREVWMPVYNFSLAAR